MRYPRRIPGTPFISFTHRSLCTFYARKAGIYVWWRGDLGGKFCRVSEPGRRGFRRGGRAPAARCLFSSQGLPNWERPRSNNQPGGSVRLSRRSRPLKNLENTRCCYGGSLHALCSSLRDTRRSENNFNAQRVAGRIPPRVFPPSTQKFSQRKLSLASPHSSAEHAS